MADSAPSDSGGHDSFSDFVDGDRAAAAQLRRSLAILGEHFDGQPLGRQIAAALAGRTTFRELSRDPEFASMALAGMQEYADLWEAMDPEERARLAEQSDEAAELARRAVQ